MKRALVALSLLALAALLVVLLAPLGRRSPIAQPPSWSGRQAFSSKGSGALRAGAAKVRIPVHPGAPLAGYAGVRRWEGRGDDVFARALVLEARGLRQTLVSLETLLVSADLEEEVFRRARLAPAACALIAATHTHSGPGGTWNNVLAAVLGNGLFDRQQRDAVAQAAADAIEAAAAQLRPARLFATQHEVDLAVSRSGAPVDGKLTVLRVDGEDRRRLASVVVYGMHPTERGRSPELSGDWPGQASRFLEERDGGVALVLQGAVGNATWPRPSRVPAGSSLAVHALHHLASAHALEDALSCAVRLVVLPPPQASAAVPWPLRRAAANVLALADPQLAVQVDLTLGGLRLLGIPGEPVGPLAMAFEQAHPRSAVVGLADGYVGYVETPRAFAAGTGEAGKSYFGPDLARALGL